ncbi:MAG: hypothetical protein J0M08_11675 [Bacteroidetes bacterium]|nr:hypothetical protein [Bacteroidota bacterium]
MSVFNEKTSSDLLKNIYKENFRLLIITVLGCTLLAIAFSFLIRPRYLAKTSFFVPSGISFEQVIDNPQFGYDIDADRLLQLLSSEELKFAVINKFDLINYFEIDTTEYDWRAKISEKFDKRIVSNRTKVMSIVISAETHDPYFSAEIISYMLEYVQQMRQRIYKTNTQQAVFAFESELKKKKVEVDSLKAAILTIRKTLKINNVALVNSQLLMSSDRHVDNPEQETELETLTQKYINEHNRLNDLKGKYENAMNIQNRKVPQLYIIDKPTPLFKKVFPLLGFTAAIGFFGSLFLMLAGLYFKHVYTILTKTTV